MDEWIGKWTDGGTNGWTVKMDRWVNYNGHMCHVITVTPPPLGSKRSDITWTKC